MTLGVTSLTGYAVANINGSSGTFARTRKFTASTSESIGSIEFYFDSTYDGDAIVKLFIANSSGTILGITGVVTAPASGGTTWCGGSITPVSVTSGQDYYLGMYISSTSCNGSGRVGIYRDGSSPTDSYYDDVSGTYTSPPSALGTLTNSADYSSMAIRGTAAAVVLPTVTSLSTNPPNLGSVTITGTGFPTSQTGSAGITIGGVSQTVTWNTSTSCSISSVDIGANKFGTNVSLIVTDASGNASTGYTTQFAARSGGAYVNLSGTLASSGNRITSTPDLASGDQVEYYGATGGTIPTDVTVNSDGSYDVSSGVTAFNFRVNNGTDWGTAGTETIGTLPSLSNLIPSGTIGTQTTATVGATTDQSSGTLYYILSATQSHITGVTVAQVKAGNNSSGVAATKSGNTTVSTSTPSIGVTGLTANTTYYYAEVQNTSAGDSIVYTGSFSTAANVVASNERNIHQAIHQPIYKAIGRAI